MKIIAKTVLLPLIIGAIIRRLAPRWAERLSQPINALSGKVLMAGLLALLALNLGGTGWLTYDFDQLNCFKMLSIICKTLPSTYLSLLLLT